MRANEQYVYAVERSSGLITALVLVRPNRSLSEVDVRAVCNKVMLRTTRC